MLDADLPNRLERALADADELVARRAAVGAPGGDLVASREYLEIVQLKMKLELESARMLAGAARIGTELTQAAEVLRRQAQAEGR